MDKNFLQWLVRKRMRNLNIMQSLISSFLLVIFIKMQLEWIEYAQKI